jgi:hypothetical protein
MDVTKAARVSNFLVTKSCGLVSTIPVQILRHISDGLCTLANLAQVICALASTSRRGARRS